MPKRYVELDNGFSGRKGKPRQQDEVKEKMNLTLTPTVKAKLQEAKKETRLSPSEIIERWVRSKDFQKFIEPLVIEEE